MLPVDCGDVFFDPSKNASFFRKLSSRAGKAF
jgi:hypothetical protein